jgi:hypothetical protein
MKAISKFLIIVLILFSYQNAFSLTKLKVEIIKNDSLVPRGMKLTAKDFLLKVNNVNKKLALRKLDVINDSDCVEIIRILNTLRYIEKDKNFKENKKMNSAAKKFFSYTSLKNKFAYDLNDYIYEKGGGVIFGTGIKYTKYNIDNTERNMSNNAVYFIIW